MSADGFPDEHPDLEAQQAARVEGYRLAAVEMLKRPNLMLAERRWAEHWVRPTKDSNEPR